MSQDVEVSENVSEKKQSTDPRFNMEPVLVEVPGTPYDVEMRKWNKPYVYRPFPKMLYKAERYAGSIQCGAPEPKPWEFKEERELRNAIEAARHFTDKCQLTVNNDTEYARAMESGFRESPAEAVKHCDEREKAFTKEVAHSLHDERNFSPEAKAARIAAEAEAGEPLAEIERTPVRRRKAS
jgi:hypothetical protein